MSFTIFSKNVMNVAFLSKKKIYIYIYIYSDPKNEDIVKILWYFFVFLDFFFDIIKLGEPKFMISHTKSILIFSLLEAVRAANASIYKKRLCRYSALTPCTQCFSLCKLYSGNSALVLWCKARMCVQCFCTVHLQCHFVEPLCLFLVLNSSYSTKQHCSYIFFFFFLSVFLLYFFFFLYILLYWHNKFHNIFTIIDSANIWWVAAL